MLSISKTLYFEYDHTDAIYICEKGKHEFYNRKDIVSNVIIIVLAHQNCIKHKYFIIICNGVVILSRAYFKRKCTHMHLHENF